MEESEASILYTREDAIALIRLNRPRKLNAIDPRMVRELGETIAAIRADPAIRAVIITGEGRAFSAGADIAAMAAMPDPPAFYRFIEAIQTTFSAIEELDRPVIAAINGIALGGGCELALCCDLRVMAEDAAIGVPEITLGMLPGAGGTQRLPRHLPPAIARQAIYFGEPLPAAQAGQHGLVNSVVPREEVLPTARAWARKLVELPPLALRAAKLLVQTSLDADLHTGIAAERQTVAFLFGTRDRAEGMRAFLDKRAPRFLGQ